ncbi:MAG: Hpt domain-containing protein [Bradyrhizobiaceae bacterium]|nr:MAG: Hpt domain-containing protein [Bradyrhizobiaceae bacterium]
MHPLLQQVPWMSSPPLVPDRSAIDLDHLRRMTLGDPALELEVLRMFRAQSSDLQMRLEALPADAPALAHTLKGSSRAIGAFDVSDAAQALESALRTGSNPMPSLELLTDALDEARAAIDAILSGRKS